MQAVHQSLIDAFRIAPTHRNVVLQVHEPHRFLGRPDAPSPEHLTNVTIFCLAGRSLEAKRRLYTALVERLAAFGIPPRCVLVRVIEQPPENFGVRGGQPICDIDLGYPVQV